MWLYSRAQPFDLSAVGPCDAVPSGHATQRLNTSCSDAPSPASSKVPPDAAKRQQQRAIRAASCGDMRRLDPFHTGLLRSLQGGSLHAPRNTSSKQSPRGCAAVPYYSNMRIWDVSFFSRIRRFCLWFLALNRLLLAKSAKVLQA